jgi:hypothetical protein
LNSPSANSIDATRELSGLSSTIPHCAMRDACDHMVVMKPLS